MAVRPPAGNGSLARVATAEQVALAAKLRADLEGGVARGTFPDHHEAALDAAVLEKAVADTVGTHS